MNKFVKCLYAVAFIVVISACLLLAACGGNVTVTYDFNYEGSPDRQVVTVAPGTYVNKDVSWPRAGYKFIGWSTDKNGGEIFDYNNAVNGDVVLYAQWEKLPKECNVYFDLNYDGCALGETITVTAGEKIRTDEVPSVERLGMLVNGWFTDKECTTQWKMRENIVNDDITLYAGYVNDPSIPRDLEGNIVYENVIVDVWTAQMGNILGTQLMEITNKFNAEYAGKIQVKLSSNLPSQQQYCLRMQQAENMVYTIDNYYNISDIYLLAGISDKLEDGSSVWFDKGSSVNYANGTLYSVPLCYSVPYIAYNKALMAKYNGNKPLPSSYSEFKALFRAVYEGEKQTRNFAPVAANLSDWTWTEYLGTVPLIQNGAYNYRYDYATDTYYNDWDEDCTAMQHAMKNLYSFFGKNGEIHGRNVVPSVASISNGTNFMGLIGDSMNILDYASDPEIGVMPISGLFSDNPEYKDEIYGNTYGIQFCRGGTAVSVLQMAAGAIWADYVSSYSWKFAEKGFYPVHKNTLTSKEFASSTNATVQALKQVCNPENISTLYGKVDMKTIKTEYYNNMFSRFILEKENPDDAYFAKMAFEYRKLLSGCNIKLIENMDLKEE